MINRINGVIAREKIKHPRTPGIILLGYKIVEVINRKIKKSYTDLRIRLTKDSTFTGEHEMIQCSLFPKNVLDIILHDLKPISLLDVGCGTGASLNYFIENGVDAWGIENSSLAIKLSKNPEKILKHNLNKEVDLNKKFGLVWCFEVIEHIHPDYESAMLKTLTNHSDILILSAATPGQGGTGHFNEQTEEYWINRFSDLGYNFDKEMSHKLKHTGDSFSENLMCYRKR
jgi:SAM-dependent methyltransferase